MLELFLARAHAYFQEKHCKSDKKKQTNKHKLDFLLAQTQAH